MCRGCNDECERCDDVCSERDGKNKNDYKPKKKKENDNDGDYSIKKEESPSENGLQKKQKKSFQLVISSANFLRLFNRFFNNYFYSIASAFYILNGGKRVVNNDFRVNILTFYNLYITIFPFR